MSEHAPRMKARLAVAQWLIDVGLVPDGWSHTWIEPTSLGPCVRLLLTSRGPHPMPRRVSAHGPPLASPYAAPVAALAAHTRDGLLALRHDDAAALGARPELRSLGEERRAQLVSVLLAEAGKAVAAAHDEL